MPKVQGVEISAQGQLVQAAWLYPHLNANFTPTEFILSDNNNFYWVTMKIIEYIEQKNNIEPLLVMNF